MITNHQMMHRNRGSVIAAHVSDEISRIFGTEVIMQQHCLDEIAKAVECFLMNENTNGYIDSRYLVVLASKALSSIGKDEAARKLMIFGTNLVEPQEWEFNGDKAIWVLDLRRMTVCQDDLIELVFFNSLSVVIESIADVWDKRGGDGVLALKHVCQTAELLLGKNAKKKQLNSMADEIISLCTNRLDNIGKKKNWPRTPHVINLDN